MLSEALLQREAAVTGFRQETLEKVIHLMELLEGLRSHPFLKTCIALKGGTALNLFIFDVPRLKTSKRFPQTWTGNSYRFCAGLSPRPESGLSDGVIGSFETAGSYSQPCCL